MALDGCVSFVDVKVGRFNHRDFAPGGERGWRHGSPRLAIVIRQLN